MVKKNFDFAGMKVLDKKEQKSILGGMKWKGRRKSCNVQYSATSPTAFANAISTPALRRVRSATVFNFAAF
ncbi:hypothetical protein [Aquimarina sp. RZ0]|uniref:hypothetical protein n=1 Tax=Aquimarina sp. RZ0 TaxID=2607730 RepID=UPI0011F1C4A2|nr:hypothetical protein [Aquimarina sp. RZ0]KAA1245440.1 hypothetical protein F0000_12330 [Aquimarina sp. RZ0]